MKITAIKCVYLLLSFHHNCRQKMNENASEACRQTLEVLILSDVDRRQDPSNQASDEAEQGNSNSGM